jgi:glucosylceramidase
VVVMNGTAQPQRYRLVIDGLDTQVEIPAHAIQTVVRQE